MAELNELIMEIVARADITQLRELRQTIDTAILAKEDDNKRKQEALDREKAEIKATKKALGIKRKYATRKDKGTKRKPKPDQVTE